MDYKNLKVEFNQSWCLIKIMRPEFLNALNSELLKELKILLEDLNSRKELKVVVITGEGKAFAAGADIAAMKNMNPHTAREFAELGHQVFTLIEQNPKIFIAAVNGFALGGGCELSLACDIRLAGEKAVFGQPEINLGIIPGFGGTQRLPKIIGAARAKELIFTGKKIKADEAEKMGLVNQIIKDDQLLEEAKNMAEEIAAKSAPILSFAKEAVNQGLEKDTCMGIKEERNLFALCFSTADQEEGMEAFLNKRKVDFKDK